MHYGDSGRYIRQQFGGALHTVLYVVYEAKVDVKAFLKVK